MWENQLEQKNIFQLGSLGALLGVFAGFSALHYVTQVEPAWIEVKELRLPLKRLGPSFEGLRLVQISDIHLGGWLDRKEMERVVRLVLDLKPDVVALTGDYLVGSEWHPKHAGLLDDLAVSLRPLAETGLLVAILGNHDHWVSAPAVREMLARAGALDLSNRVHTLHRGAEQLHLAGVDDLYDGHDRFEDVLRAIPEQGEAILLAHEPDFADTSASSGRFGLQISGHTHGGQVVLPLIGPPVLPRYGKKYPSGLYRVGEMYQYTNRGIGSGGMTVRFGCRPEITVFTLSAD